MILCFTIPSNLTVLEIWHCSLLTSNLSSGLLLIIINFFSQVVVYFYLPDLPTVEGESESGSDGDKGSEWLRMFRVIFGNAHIAVPFLTIFTFNFNWQFIETALAPASHDVFGWGPVQNSYILGGMAVLVFLGMTAVHRFSQIGVSDFKLLFCGLFVNTIGYLMLYMLWARKCVFHCL